MAANGNLKVRLSSSTGSREFTMRQVDTVKVQRTLEDVVLGNRRTTLTDGTGQPFLVDGNRYSTVSTVPC